MTDLRSLQLKLIHLLLTTGGRSKAQGNELIARLFHREQHLLPFQVMQLWQEEGSLTMQFLSANLHWQTHGVGPRISGAFIRWREGEDDG